MNFKDIRTWAREMCLLRVPPATNERTYVGTDFATDPPVVTLWRFNREHKLEMVDRG